MKRTVKVRARILALLLAVVMAASMLPFGALAEGEEIPCLHQHEAACFAPEQIFYEETPGAQAVYPLKTVVINPGHTHDENCYDEENALICTVEEGPAISEDVSDTEAPPLYWVLPGELICPHKDCPAGGVCLVESENPVSAAEETENEAQSEAPAAGGALLSPLSAADDITDLALNISFENYQTWTELTTGAEPPEFIVTLGVTLSEDYSGGGTIEVPLDFVPSAASHPDFTYGVDGLGGAMPPFFVPLTDSLLSHDIVKDYTIDTDKLIIILKDKGEDGFTAGLSTIALRFDFNGEWKGKIPGGALLWQVTAEAKVNGNTAAAAIPKSVYGGANIFMEPNLFRMFPANENYYENIALRINTRHTYYYRAALDPTYNNIVYLDIPKGTTVPSAITAYFNQPYEPDYNSSGYDRYWRILDPTPDDDDHADWNLWHYNGRLEYCTQQMNEVWLTPPLLSDGAQFDIRLGADYRYLNGALKHNTVSLPYKKAFRPLWELQTPNYHQTSDSSVYQVICGLENGDVSHSSPTGGAYAMYAPYYRYDNPSSLKNTGAGPISGVSYELYQADSGAAKVNFNNVTLYALRDNAESGSYPPWAQYKVQYEIIDTNSTAITSDDVTLPLDDNMGIWQPVSGSISASNVLSLPDLAPGQYINKIIVTPMGTDGQTAGELPSRNGFALVYRAKAWNDREWPDGSSIGDFTAVPMRWKFNYNNDPSAAVNPSAPLTHIGSIAYIYYTEAPYAQASFTSSNAGGRFPGDTVNYTILGYNHEGFTVGTWENPRVMVRVPAIMELTGDAFTAKDAKTDAVFNVSATLTHSDAAYKWYAFQIANYSAPEGNGYTPVFSIPVSFRISATATPGTYPLRVLLSARDGEKFTQSADLNQYVDNALSGDDKANYGLDGSEHYYMMRGESGPAANAPLVVFSDTNIGVKTTIATSATNNVYVESAVIPAGRDEDVKVRLTVSNNGSAPVTNIRLYDILPYAGDLPGHSVHSSGSITFASITPTGGAVVKYTAAVPGSTYVPLYGAHGSGNPDLQTAVFQNNAVWTTSSPGASARAIFIDFGDKTLNPGESFNVDMTFNVPNNANQTAYNLFRYSAVEAANPSAKLNGTSPIAGFSTEAIAIVYDENLPTPATSHDDDLRDFPASASAIIGFEPALGDNKDTLKVSAAQPTLSGYTFSGWNTANDGNGDIWAANAEKEFTKGGTLTLYAQWQRNTYSVTYKPGEHGTFAEATSDGLYYNGNTPAAPATDGEAGWAFSAWSPTPGGKVKGSAEYTAQWTAKTYTVNYDMAGGKYNDDAAPAARSGVKWSDDKLLPGGAAYSAAKALKTGYNFNGWKVTSGGSGDGVTSSAKFSELATDDDVSSITLTAQWTIKDYTLYYDLNDKGDTEYPAQRNGGAENDTLDYNEALNSAAHYDDVSAGGKNAPLRNGYTFGGWYLEESCATPVGSTLMGAADKTIYAKWTPAEYTISYYDYDDSSLNLPSNPSSYDVKDLPLTITQSPSRDSYTFSGWTAEYYNGGEWVSFAMGKSAPQSPHNDIIPDGNAIYGNIRLKANYTLNAAAVYTLSFVLNGSGEFPVTPLSIAPAELNAGDKISEAPGYAVPVRAGHKFGGWYLENSFNTLVDESTPMPDSDQSIYANWTRFYTVTFNPAGGIIAAGDEKREIIPPQSSLGASMPPNPQRSGYSFGGWYTAVSGGSLFTALTPVNADIELWAGWILDIESDPTPPPQQPEPTGTPTPTPTPTPEPSPTPEDPEPTPEPTPTTEEPTPTPTPEDPEPEPQPELPPDRPGVIIVPGTPAVPPAPANPGSSLVPELNDDGEEILLEIGEDGVPLGEWHYEPVEEVWIYEPYTPMAEVPPTGDGGAYIAAALFAVSAMAFMALVKAGKKRA